MKIHDPYGPGWKVIADYVKASRGRCQDCGGTQNIEAYALEAHHNRYPKTLTEKDLTVLCSLCHADVEWRKKNRHRLDKFIQSRTEATRYLRVALEDIEAFYSEDARLIDRDLTSAWERLEALKYRHDEDGQQEERKAA